MPVLPVGSQWLTIKGHAHKRYIYTSYYSSFEAQCYIEIHVLLPGHAT